MAAVASTPSRRSIAVAVASRFPILDWGRRYDRKLLRPDLIAGVTVAAFAIPEDVAYASLAGLEPQHALYANLIALLVYAVMGTSRQLSYSVTSALSIMVAGTLGTMAFSSPDQYAAAAAMVAVMSGIMALLAGVFRIGFIVNFVSESVLTGFSAGAALYIAASQISKLFGIEGVQGNFFARIWNVVEHIGDTNGWTLALGAISIVALLALEEYVPKLPGSLIVTAIAITVMWTSNLESRGVDVAGAIPGGLPAPAWPSVGAEHLNDLVILAFGVFLLSYVEGVGAARTFAVRHKYEIDANQELYANGGANLVSGLMQGYSVGGSMSRSAVSDANGARTPLAGLFAAMVLAIVLLFLTEPFTHLPETTLAAIVIVAVKGLIDIPALKRLLRISKPDFIAAALTMLGVLTFGMLEGIIIGVLFSFLAVLKRVSLPNSSLLGLRPGTTDFVDVERNPDVEVSPDILVFRPNAGLFYANMPVVKDDLIRIIDSRETPPAVVVIDLASAPNVDLGTAESLAELADELRAKGIALRFASVYGEVHDFLVKAGYAEQLGPIFPNESVAEVLERWRATPAASPAAAPAADPETPGAAS
ncbi:MAG TPA: sulfate permease [Thermomicrobiales bacterium]|nr:sulfate permease [Thermomicrobiales bacterium]